MNSYYRKIGCNPNLINFKKNNSMSQNSLRYYLSQAQIRPSSKNSHKPMLTNPQALNIKKYLKNLNNIPVKIFQYKWRPGSSTYYSIRRSFEDIINDLKNLTKQKMKKQENKSFLTAAISIKKSHLPFNIQQEILRRFRNNQLSHSFI